MSVKNIWQKNFLITVIILLSSLFIKAQNSDIPLVTDRPDITESAIVVPDSTFQIENGILFESQNSSGSTIHNISLSSLLIRFRMMNNIEFRIGGNYQIMETSNNFYKISTSGISNVSVGAKGQFLKQNINGIDMAAILQFNFQGGSNFYQQTEIESEIIIAIGKNLYDKLSLSGNLGISKNSGLNDNIYVYSTSLGIDLHSGWGAFAEIYGEVSNISQATFNYDIGLTYQILNNLQFDFSIGTDSIIKYDKWFAGLGVSVRFPK